MDSAAGFRYFSNMIRTLPASLPRPAIPVYALYGEEADFPDALHCEGIWDRAHVYDWVIAPHRHPGLDQVFFIASGGGWAELDGARRALVPPCAIWAPRRVVHGFRFEKDTRGHVVSLPAAETRALVEGPGAGDPALAAFARAPRMLAGDAAIEAAVEALHDAWRGRGAARGPLLRALALALLARLARAAADSDAAAPGRGEARMAEFEALVRAHLADAWKTPDYARALGCSATHLARLTRAHAGRSPAAFATALRMQEARRMLAYTMMDVAEVGYRLGFEDPSYFSRAFRREVGVSPGEFRRPFREG